MVNIYVHKLVKTFLKKNTNNQLTRYEQSYEQVMLIIFAFNLLSYNNLHKKAKVMNSTILLLIYIYIIIILYYINILELLKSFF